MMSEIIWSTTLQTQTIVFAAGIFITHPSVGMHTRRYHADVVQKRAELEKVPSAKSQHRDTLLQYQESAPDVNFADL